MQILKRIRFLKWEKKVSNHEHGVKLISVRRRPHCVLKQLVWKVKSQWWRQRQRSSMQFSYDFHSYSLNFDDGFCRNELNPTPDYRVLDIIWLVEDKIDTSVYALDCFHY
ncbi:hypothetical protein Gotri_018419 [Gossypium trilobum]|uniref:Uncharacterized protein n=1 Tax=Gossypium trilobum TaxID=34281 RepID=A0A7J9E9L9_9ROSI|nr:hypothetical protein [Gossypium trilobum]